MSNLRISIGTSALTLEIEGEESAALKLLKEFEDTRLEVFTEKMRLYTKTNNLENGNPQDSTHVEEPSANTFKETLPNLIIKYPKLSQKEWMAIFAYYLDSDRFTADSLRQRFNDEGVMTQNKSKNFSTDIKRAIKDELIRKMNDKEYSLTPNGRAFAETYINGQA